MRSTLETLYPDRSSYKLSIYATNHGFCRRFKAVLNLARGNDRTLPQSFQTEGRARATLTIGKEDVYKTTLTSRHIGRNTSL